jgi:hypothetical protein
VYTILYIVDPRLTGVNFILNGYICRVCNLTPKKNRAVLALGRLDGHARPDARTAYPVHWFFPAPLQCPHISTTRLARAVRPIRGRSPYLERA